jgi:16S rRNA (uracil1498-N3)-methyltransferase
VNSGGAQSVARVAGVPQLEVEFSFGPETAAALFCWQVRPGAVVTLVDGENACWRARLTSLNPDGGTAIPFRSLLRSLESPLALEVYQALPEKERFELVLEKLTELGATRLVPMVTERSSTVAERDASQKKSHRWPEVIRRAAIQCRRAQLPELGECLDFTAALDEVATADLRLFLFEGEEPGWTLREALRGEHPQRVALLVGPEGGFSAGEFAQARAAGCLPVSLGPRILRTESAAIAATAALQFALGDLW